MPRLTNEPSAGGIIDQQNGSSSSAVVASTSGGDVYIIPEYSSRAANNAQTLLVLPFVPHPSMPPPHYFGARAAAPSYHDPPPEYETVSQGLHHLAPNEGLTPSCSCTTQLTNISSDDYHSGAGGGHPLQGIYDNSGIGGCGLDHNEALAASYLYPELFATVTSRPLQQNHRSRNNQRRRPQSSVSTISTVSVSTVAETMAMAEDQRMQYLTIKRWVLVVLILMLLMTISLLVGISLQHFQLLRKFLDTKAEYENASSTATTSVNNEKSPEIPTTAAPPPITKMVDLLLHSDENYIPK